MSDDANEGSAAMLGSVANEPVAWAVIDGDGDAIYASPSRLDCYHRFTEKEFDQRLSLVPLYAAPPRDRVVRLPDDLLIGHRLIKAALDEAGVKWVEVAG